MTSHFPYNFRYPKDNARSRGSMKGQVLYEKRQTKDGHVAILTMDNKRLG